MIIGKKKDISFIDILSLIKCPEKYHWKIVWIYAFYYPSNLVYLEDKRQSQYLFLLSIAISAIING